MEGLRAELDLLYSRPSPDEDGDIKIMVRRAYEYLKNCEYKTALDAFKAACDAGSPTAAFELGRAYHYGGMTLCCNRSEHLRLWRLALRLPLAMASLGWHLYLHGWDELFPGESRFLIEYAISTDDTLAVCSLASWSSHFAQDLFCKGSNEHIQNLDYLVRIGCPDAGVRTDTSPPIEPPCDRRLN